MRTSAIQPVWHLTKRGFKRGLLVTIGLIAVMGCGLPSTAGSGPIVDIGACIGEGALHHLNQAGVLSEIETWWELEARTAISGDQAGDHRPSSDRSRRINSEAATRIAGTSPPESPHYVSTSRYEAISTHAGLILAGSKNPDGDANSLSVLAFVDPDGSVRFAGDCATKEFTEPFAEFVADQHPGSTEEQVLRDSIATGDFTAFDTWLQGPSPSRWVDQPPELRNLDIEETPAEILADLQSVMIMWEGLEPWSDIDATLCPWVPMGWNTCIWLGAATQDGAVPTSAFLVPGERIELWLFDGEPDGATPALSLLATIPTIDLDRAQTIVLSFTGSPRSVDEIIDGVDKEQLSISAAGH